VREVVGRVGEEDEDNYKIKEQESD